MKKRIIKTKKPKEFKTLTQYLEYKIHLLSLLSSLLIDDLNDLKIKIEKLKG